MAKKFGIRNSATEFLIFMLEGKEDGIQVMYHSETIWYTQKAMSTLFDCSTDDVGLHLKNILTFDELRKDSTTEFFSVVQIEGGWQVSRRTLFHNLDAIISVSYRVNGVRATQLRQWCTSAIHQFVVHDYVIDRKRMKDSSFIGEDYFEYLLAEIREVRLSEHHFYQELTDIYATAIDRDHDAPTARLFFQKVQNEIHYTVHGHTAAELTVNRANSEKEHMRLTIQENAPKGKVVKTDVVTAKNYLNEVELDDMGYSVNAVLDMVERMAK